MQGTGPSSNYYVLDIQEQSDAQPPTLQERCPPLARCLDGMATLYKKFPTPAKFAGGILVGTGYAVSSPITIGTGAGLMTASLLAKIIECTRNGCSPDILCMEIAETLGAGLAGIVAWAALSDGSTEPISP